MPDDRPRSLHAVTRSVEPVGISTGRRSASVIVAPYAIWRAVATTCDALGGLGVGEPGHQATHDGQQDTDHRHARAAPPERARTGERLRLAGGRWSGGGHRLLPVTRTCNSPTGSARFTVSATSWVPTTGAPPSTPVQVTCQTLVTVTGHVPRPAVRSGSDRWV